MKLEAFSGTEEIGKVASDAMHSVRVSQYSRDAARGIVRAGGLSRKWRYGGDAGTPMRFAYNRWNALAKALETKRKKDKVRQKRCGKNSTHHAKKVSQKRSELAKALAAVRDELPPLSQVSEVWGGKQIDVGELRHLESMVQKIGLKAAEPDQPQTPKARCRAVMPKPPLEKLEKSPCGHDIGESVANRTRDRYGLPSFRRKCNACDLTWLELRPTAEWYANFYASGTYRKLVSAYHGRDVMATIEQEQQEYALRLIRRLPKFSGGRILDVGGSTGTVGRCVALAMNGIVDVLDPASECNDNPMVNFIQGSLESWEASHKYKLVLLCQTIDHLLEPRLCLEKIQGLLASDGLFFVDILDVEQEVAQKGWQQTLKIDHCTYFTDKSARLLLNATGFEIVDSWESAANHVGYLCKGRI